ncbi:MAG: hypothetical protein K5675_05800 [Lachnospiraceae bacterium]|nr:hypothetical protein [Lachnospiraceae bacterium]
MQTCPKCNITIRGNKKCCPLCEGRLNGEGEDGAFPVIKTKPVSTTTLFRIALFIGVLTIITLGFLGFINISWAKSLGLVSMIIIFALIDLAVAIYYRSNLLKLFTVEAYVIMLGVYLIDNHIKAYHWSIAFVIPSIFLALMLLTVLMGHFNGLLLGEYLSYVIIDVLLSFLQIIPIRLGQNPWPYLAAGCIAFMLAITAFLLIFRFKEFKNAAAKYWNM